MKNKLLLVALLILTCVLSAQNIPQLSGQVLISVNVTGFVANPGTYQLTPLARIYDAVKVANDNNRTTRCQPLPPADQGSRARFTLPEFACEA